MMKIKALVEGILTGIVLAIFCYWVLISPEALAAIAVRRRMPDAWFSGLIEWYAMFAVIGVSIVVAGVACRMVYKHASSPKSMKSKTAHYPNSLDINPQTGDPISTCISSLTTK